MTPRKICVVVGSRANYGSIKSAMRAIAAHPGLELQVVAGASALLDRYGAVAGIIEDDGFEIAARAYMLIEGETPVTMAKSAGLGLLELPTIFESLRPDIVLTVGDRFETIATAIAAAYMNVPLAHTMGGEVSGTIDESVRHAVTKFAHIHFPANRLAAENIIRMGEDPRNVHVVGCPRIDLVSEVIGRNGSPPVGDIAWDGVGDRLDLSEPYLLVAQYPVTTEYEQARNQIDQTLHALLELQIPAVMLWPNADAGADDIARGIRIFRDQHPEVDYLHVFKNLPTELYARVMANSACIVGNTSSAIRESAFLGVPAVNVGTRQSGRERGSNVIDVDYDTDQIARAVTAQVAHGKYPSEAVYGDGHAGVRIADILATTDTRIQKRLVYAERSPAAAAD